MLQPIPGFTGFTHIFNSPPPAGATMTSSMIMFDVTPYEINIKRENIGLVQEVDTSFKPLEISKFKLGKGLWQQLKDMDSRTGYDTKNISNNLFVTVKNPTIIKL